MKTRKNHEPIIWQKENGPLKKFLKVAEGIGHEYVIYVQDASADHKSVWACVEKDLVGCFITFSDKGYWGNLQPLELALTYGFDDEDFTNDHSYSDVEP